MTDFARLEEKENYSLIQMDDGKANAFSFAMIEALNGCLDRATELKKPIVLAGREGMFCAGFDLKVMQGDNTKDRDRLLHEGFQLSYRFISTDLPTVAFCQGHALAMGGLMLLSCDYRLAVEGKAKIGLNEVSVGVTMPPYGVDLVKERIGLSHQIPTLALGVVYDVQHAQTVGFIDAIVTNDGAEKHLHAIAQHLGQMDPAAHIAAKKALRSNFLKTYQTEFNP